MKSDPNFQWKILIEKTEKQNKTKLYSNNYKKVTFYATCSRSPMQASGPSAYYYRRLLEAKPVNDTLQEDARSVPDGLLAKANTS